MVTRLRGKPQGQRAPAAGSSRERAAGRRSSRQGSPDWRAAPEGAVWGGGHRVDRSSPRFRRAMVAGSADSRAERSDRWHRGTERPLPSHTWKGPLPCDPLSRRFRLHPADTPTRISPHRLVPGIFAASAESPHCGFALPPRYAAVTSQRAARIPSCRSTPLKAADDARRREPGRRTRVSPR